MPHIPQSDRLAQELDRVAPAARPGTMVAPPSPWKLLRVWLALGVQSFGGGTATLYLIRRAVVEQQRWISDEEFTRDWAICQVAPGINLLGVTTLIGWRLRGALGIALALLGLLLPSATITIALTALYSSIRDLPAVHAALRGVVPATAGLGLLLALRMARPVLTASGREGRVSLALSCALLLGSGLAMLWHPPVVGVLWVSGAIGAAAHWWRAAHARGQEP